MTTLRLVPALSSGQCLAADADRHHREVVSLFSAARGRLDRVVAIMETDGSAAHAGHQRGGRAGVADAITDAIGSLDLAFEHWFDGLDGPST